MQEKEDKGSDKDGEKRKQKTLSINMTINAQTIQLVCKTAPELPNSNTTGANPDLCFHVTCRPGLSNASLCERNCQLSFNFLNGFNNKTVNDISRYHQDNDRENKWAQSKTVSKQRLQPKIRK